MKYSMIVLGLAVAIQGTAAPVAQEDAVSEAMEWMQDNPVMGPAGRSVASAETFPESGYSVYLVRLAPKGYLILNSDDRLPLVVSFSADSNLDLADDPNNAFRSMLLRHIERMEEQLAQPAVSIQVAAAEMAPLAVTELHGPFTETTWNQNNPYNLLCPDNPDGSRSYDYRAAVGCVPTAYAQLLNFHRWPVHGKGERSYTDSEGSITGEHHAVFSDNYNWLAMEDSYDAYDTDPDPSKDAVAELMYELGVAVGANYEDGGTFASPWTLGERLADYFFFEACEIQHSQSELIPALEADLRAGFPCEVSVPGHSMIADGLMVDDGVTTYHINLGWGGSNNGWWTADNVDGDELEYGVTSLRPRLLAFPQTNSVAVGSGESAELRWILPKRREAEVQKLSVMRLEEQVGTWQENGEAVTASGASGWVVDSAGHSGNCWFSGPFITSTMVLDEVFIPDVSSELTFWLSYRLGSAIFSVSASTNNGLSYTELYTVNDNYDASWSQQTVSLAAYAGQQVRLRVAVSGGSHYSNGGVWLDDLAMTSGDWHAWQLFALDETLASYRFSDATNLWDECADFSIFENTSTSTSKDWVCTSVSGADTCFFKIWSGSGEYHLTSRSAITPTLGTRLLLRLKTDFWYDAFRVKVSTDGSTFSQVWWTDDREDWRDVSIVLAAYAGQAIYVRLEYDSGNNSGTRGVWIDSIHLTEAGNPDMEGQPVHYTTLTNLPPGIHTLSALLTDNNAVGHGLAPAVTLMVEDADGMPNDWEELNGLNPYADDEALDPDEDGYSNIEEYICGTAPTNASSCWLLESGEGALPAFYAAEDRHYTIQYRTGMVSGIWMPLAADIPGSNGIIEVGGYDSATNAARFYRVQVQPAN